MAAGNGVIGVAALTLGRGLQRLRGTVFSALFCDILRGYAVGTEISSSISAGRANGETPCVRWPRMTTGPCWIEAARHGSLERAEQRGGHQARGAARRSSPRDWPEREPRSRRGTNMDSQLNGRTLGQGDWGNGGAGTVRGRQIGVSTEIEGSRLCCRLTRFGLQFIRPITFMTQLPLKVLGPPVWSVRPK